MDCRSLYEHVFNAYKTYDITTFPINCFEIIQQQGFRIIKYSELNKSKKEACRELSDDACLIEDKLYYDFKDYKYGNSSSTRIQKGYTAVQTKWI